MGGGCLEYPEASTVGVLGSDAVASVQKPLVRICFWLSWI